MKRTFHLLLAIASCAVAPADDVYLFTSYRGEGDGLHLASSSDALEWTDLERVFLKPEVGSKLMRDPHILRGPDGLYHMVWTSGWYDKGIGYAHSKDLLTWSDQKLLPVTAGIKGAQTAWAPELYWLEEQKTYLIVWSSGVAMAGKEDSSNLSMYELRHGSWYVLTKDFESFSDPKIFFDPGFDNVDTTMVRMGDKYLIFLKKFGNERPGLSGPIRVAEAGQPLGAYRLLDEPVLEDADGEAPDSTHGALGPAPVVLGDKVLVYFDHYFKPGYGARESSGLKEWNDVTARTSVVPDQRQGSILKVSAEILEGLRD